jgi:DNA repair photolyase
MGCAFGDSGCGIYCYLADSPIGLYAAKPWRQWLRAKVNASEALRRDIEHLHRPTEARVFMSSRDPY